MKNKIHVFLNIFLIVFLICFVITGMKLAHDTKTNNNYHTACLMYNPLIPIGYESFYNDGPNYIVIYEGHTRWNNEKCAERECVDVEEYRRAKLIVGETK